MEENNMASSDPQLDKVRAQFTRQAAAYARMRQACDETAFRNYLAFSHAEPRHRVLDVACGPGFMTMVFATHCEAVIGFDATDSFLALATAEAARRGLDNLRFEHGNAETLPYDDASFDLVLCRAAFHHMSEPALVLAEMARVTRPGGHLLIADMLASSDAEQAAYHNRMEQLCDPSHVRALATHDFDAMYDVAGLHLVARRTSAIHHKSVAEWMEHGGPPPEAANEIMAMMEASLNTDRSGLAVRREDGLLRFNHTEIADLVAVPSKD
jgi:ubiquinone/menaquinone biosynthesis C-methylase UbiE